MSEITYREAIVQALADELAADDDVFILGEDVGAAGGVFKTVDGLWERFGGRRVRDTPISEQAIVGCAIGAAVTGLRPVVDLMFADFAASCYDQIINELPKYRYMTGGQVSLPVTIRMANGAGGGFGAQHSQAAENWFLSEPALQVCVPGTPADAYGLLRSAIREDNPVLVLEHKNLFNTKGPAPAQGGLVPLGKADVVRTGEHVTVVATQLMRQRALEAAELLAAEGVEIEIVDPRTVAPLDVHTIAASVAKTNRLAIVQEAPVAGSWGSTLVGLVLAAAFDDFDAPPVLIGAPDTPIPYAESLEQAWLPSVERVVAAVRELVA